MITARMRIFEELRGQTNGSTSNILAMSLAQSLAVSGETAVGQGAERQADSGTVQVGDRGGELLSSVPCTSFHP